MASSEPASRPTFGQGTPRGHSGQRPRQGVSSEVHSIGLAQVKSIPTCRSLGKQSCLDLGLVTLRSGHRGHASLAPVFALALFTHAGVITPA